MRQYLLMILMVIGGIGLTGCEWLFGGGDQEVVECTIEPTVQETTCTKQTPGGTQTVKGSLYSLVASSTEEQEACLKKYKLQKAYSFVIASGSTSNACYSDEETICTAEKDRWVKDKTDNGWSCS